MINGSTDSKQTMLQKAGKKIKINLHIPILDEAENSSIELSTRGYFQHRNEIYCWCVRDIISTFRKMTFLFPKGG